MYIYIYLVITFWNISQTTINCISPTLMIRFI